MEEPYVSDVIKKQIPIWEKQRNTPTKLSLKYRILVWLIVTAIKSGHGLWLVGKLAKWVALNIEIDHEKKTWKISSRPMWYPHFQERYYTEIEAMFSSDPRTFEVKEVRDATGKFKSFTVFAS